MEEKQKQPSMVKSALSFAGLMYLCMTVLFPLAIGDDLTMRNLLIGIPLWTTFGFGHAYLMRKYPYKPQYPQKKK